MSNRKSDYRSTYGVDPNGKRRFADGTYHKPSRSVGKRMANYPPPQKGRTRT
jgi:hypothetical protein